jgi:protein-L-isoaspartate(D-aspartate) O-methyltransferase
MERVPRERFAPPALRAWARRDLALPLPCGQTMTAPSVVAAMLTALDPPRGARALEVGTGSGYATALLLRLGCASVESLERYAGLAEAAAQRLDAEGFAAASVVHADGCAPGEGAFDRILVNGVVPALPDALLARLAPGGRLVGAVAGAGGARLAVVERGEEGFGRRQPEPALRLAPLTPGLAETL